MPSPEEVNAMCDVIRNDPAAFLPMLLDHIEKSVAARYNQSIEADRSTDTLPHLENRIESDHTPSLESESGMAKAKINQPVIIKGGKRWITANSLQEFTDKVADLLSKPQSADKHLFSEYAWNWYNVYSKPNVETVTATTYKRQLTLHIIPAFEEQYIEDITTDDVQRLFNNMSGAKATKEKVKIVLNQILDTAVEGGLLEKNPLKSKRIKIKGAADV